MTPELYNRYATNKLTDKDKADILADPAICDKAEFAPHVTHGMTRLHCRRYGAGTHIRINPDGRQCRACRYSDEFNGREKSDFVAMRTRQILQGFRTSKQETANWLDYVLYELGMDDSIVDSKELLADALAKAPAEVGMSEKDATDLAKDRGYVEDEIRGIP